MFQGLINSAKSAVSSLILKYVARASVAVPFVIALGFALAAIAAMLVDRFGHIAGYWLMAGGLAAIGVIAAIFVSAREQKEEVADQQAEAADTSKIATEVATQAPLAHSRWLTDASRRRHHRSQGGPTLGTQLPTRPAYGSDRPIVLADISRR